MVYNGHHCLFLFYIKHLIEIHKPQKFEVCQYCIEIYCHRDAFKLHNEQVHKNVQKVNYKCKDKTNDKSCYNSMYLLNMKDHYIQCNLTQGRTFYPYNCKKCDKSFDIKEEFLYHENDVHNANHEKLQCEACHIVYYCRQSFAVHQYGCLKNTGDFF